jgi:tRNA1Val (adenine37-N6)-methyltransferase
VDTTVGTLLGGRLRYTQPARGFRSGIEPVLLAASVPACAGDCVLEGGSGAGASLLCLAGRVPGLCGIGIERNPALAALARGNAEANALAVRFVAADVRTLPLRGRFAHAFANPPYHDAAGSPPPDAARADAKQAQRGAVTEWAAALGAVLRHGGTLTLILPPARLPEALAGCARADCGSVRLLPLWPRQGEAAKLLLLRAARGGRAPLVLLPGLALHLPAGGFTPQAEACLRAGAALTL